MHHSKMGASVHVRITLICLHQCVYASHCLMAKVDGLGKVDLPEIVGKFAPPIFIYLFMLLSIFL